MAKKEHKFKESTIENYYDLKVDKIDELVAALKDETTKFDDEINYDINANTGVYDPKNVKSNGKEKQFDPYKIDKLSRVPTWLKACFVKWWFAGVVCYFIMWGLAISDGLDRVVLCGLVLGLIVDILVNPLFKYMESDRREYDNYMMFPFPFRAFWTFFTNLIYYVFVMYFVTLSYGGINELINLIFNTNQHVYVGVEPLLFGLLAVVVDMAFIGIKDLIVFIVKKSKKKEADANV
ncbi:MAG: hypothetical protein J1G05_05865 [Clostridiales bacterium]|nr:hypothetical protein [Clostridiales bacterium]